MPRSLSKDSSCVVLVRSYAKIAVAGSKVCEEVILKTFLLLKHRCVMILGYIVGSISLD